MTTLTLTPSYRPTPRQAQAHAAPQRWTLYGGAEGGGKTRWMVEEVIALMCEYPGLEGVIGRYDYNDVMSPTQVYDRFHQTCPPELIADRYRSAPAWTRFVNGSRVTFIGLKDYSASAEYGFAAIDQAEEVPEETLRLLSGRIRQQLPSGRYPHFRVLLTCNPHPGIEWFLDAAREHPDQFVFIPALPSDNPYLPADFFAARRAAYTDDQYRRMIEGSWDVFTGQALSEFDRNIHVVPPFDTWRKWPCYRGIDWGLSAPTVCLWLAASPDGDWYFVQEYERANEIPSVNAKAIAAMSLGLTIAGSWIDPRTAQTKASLQTSTEWSVFNEFQRNGVYCQLATGSRENRLAAWKQALKPDPARRNPRTYETPAPKLYIFDVCQRLIHELPRLQYREAMQGYADDVVKVEDHAYDAGGFVLSALLSRSVPTGAQRNYVGVNVPTRRR